MNVRYNATARKEVIETAEYYYRVREALGREFLAEVDAAVTAISTNPTSFEEVRPGIRRYLLVRFPYAVYYRLPKPDTVRIIIIRHHARRPGIGMRRK